MVNISPSSAGHLFKLISQGVAKTRRELREVTELSRSTVGTRVDQLVGAGLIVEETSELFTGGRPAGVLYFNQAYPTILVADLGATHGRLAVTDAGGQIFAERMISSEIQAGPEAVLTHVCDVFDQLLEESGRDRVSVCGVGIGVPGPVDFENYRVIRAPLMPAWHKFPIREFVAARFSVPIFVDNDANMMALGEYAMNFPDASSLVLVKIGTGIGAGMILRGNVVRGSTGAEGDIGHVRIAGEKNICACGAQGCLASTASGRAIIRDLASDVSSVKTSQDVLDLLAVNDPSAVEAVSKAGRKIGEVLATLVAFLNPDVLVMGGDIGKTEILRHAAHERLLQLTQPLATRQLEVKSSPLGDRAGVFGGVELVKSKVFSAEAIDSRLENSSGFELARKGK
jgi:predicted NBD/HSP70 family sugar kinase